MKKIKLACIIDDDPIYVFGTKRLMQLTNFCESFMIFHNGREALDKLKIIIANGDPVPDIILLDLNMPVMDGWEFLDEFMVIPIEKKVLIYIVSSSIDPADMERAKKFEVVSNYIVKPIALDRLKELLMSD